MKTNDMANKILNLALPQRSHDIYHLLSRSTKIFNANCVIYTIYIYILYIQFFLNIRHENGMPKDEKNNVETKKKLNKKESGFLSMAMAPSI